MLPKKQPKATEKARWLFTAREFENRKLTKQEDGEKSFNKFFSLISFAALSGRLAHSDLVRVAGSYCLYTLAAVQQCNSMGPRMQPDGIQWSITRPLKFTVELSNTIAERGVFDGSAVECQEFESVLHHWTDSAEQQISVLI